MGFLCCWFCSFFFLLFLISNRPYKVFLLLFFFFTLIVIVYLGVCEGFQKVVLAAPINCGMHFDPNKKEWVQWLVLQYYAPEGKECFPVAPFLGLLLSRGDHVSQSLTWLGSREVENIGAASNYVNAETKQLCFYQPQSELRSESRLYVKVQNVLVILN